MNGTTSQYKLFKFNHRALVDRKKKTYHKLFLFKLFCRPWYSYLQLGYINSIWLCRFITAIYIYLIYRHVHIQAKMFVHSIHADLLYVNVTILAVHHRIKM